MTLNIGLDVTLDNMYDSKGTREKVRECNSTKLYVANDERDSPLKFQRVLHLLNLTPKNQLLHDLISSSDAQEIIHCEICGPITCSHQLGT
jgi:hypothetical protein